MVYIDVNSACLLVSCGSPSANSGLAKSKVTVNCVTVVCKHSSTTSLPIVLSFPQSTSVFKVFACSFWLCLLKYQSLFLSWCFPGCQGRLCPPLLHSSLTSCFRHADYTVWHLYKRKKRGTEGCGMHSLHVFDEVPLIGHTAKNQLTPLPPPPVQPLVSSCHKRRQRNKSGVNTQSEES